MADFTRDNLQVLFLARLLEYPSDDDESDSYWAILDLASDIGLDTEALKSAHETHERIEREASAARHKAWLQGLMAKAQAGTATGSDMMFLRLHASSVRMIEEQMFAQQPLLERLMPKGEDE